jgi:hypothetical protein
LLSVIDEFADRDPLRHTRAALQCPPPDIPTSVTSIGSSGHTASILWESFSTALFKMRNVINDCIDIFGRKRESRHAPAMATPDDLRNLVIIRVLPEYRIGEIAWFRIQGRSRGTVAVAPDAMAKLASAFVKGSAAAVVPGHRVLAPLRLGVCTHGEAQKYNNAESGDEFLHF